MRIILSFFQKFGYVSQRFFESAYLGVNLFLESNTLFTTSCDISLQFHFLLRSYLTTEIQSVFLILESVGKIGDIIDHTSRITGLEINDDAIDLTDILDNSSPFILSRLRCIDVNTTSEHQISTFCDSLMLSTTIVELYITGQELSTSTIISLSLLRSVHSFGKVKLVSLS
ncbi:hypothetical protein GEMRC1_013247 [Eukaryota sp. GEM-RC1]